MVNVDKLSDAELRTKLIEFGFPVLPITGTTRKVMAKKLKMLMENETKINSSGRRFVVIKKKLLQFVNMSVVDL